MNDHKKAQRLIQARINRVLGESESAWLDNHLQGCPACQDYSSDAQALDAELRQHFLLRQQAYPIDAFTSPSLHAIHKTLDQTRTNMYNQRIFTKASSLSFVAALVFLAGALALLLSSQFSKPFPLGSPMQTVEIPFTPNPTPTLQPTNSPEITDKEQIIRLLNRLAEENLALYKRPGWVHSQAMDAGEPGTLPAAYHESWTHYPKNDGVSAEFLSFTKDAPAGTVYYQFTVRLADGTSGDLIQLRKNPGQAEGSSPVSAPAKMSVESTQAGSLAARLAEMPVEGKTNDPTTFLVNARAWYETVNQKAAFVVQVSVKTPLSTPPIQIETRSFDPVSGLMLKESIRQEWEDGTLFAESSSLHSTEALPNPPAEVITALQSAATELKSYREQVAAPATPVTPTPQTSILDQLAYTQTSPLKDGQTILRILEALKGRHLSWMSRSGWYLFGPIKIESQGFVDNRFVLTHVLDAGAACEQMVYYRQGEQILPSEIRLADGQWGLVGWVEKGGFTEGQAEGQPCQVADLETVQFLENERAFFQSLVFGSLKGEFAAWVEELDGKPVFVLYQDVHYQAPKPSTMDPDTRKLETEDRSLTWNYYDLQTGAWLGGKYQVFLENGKSFGELPEAGNKLSLDHQYFEQPPTLLAQAFEQAVMDLQRYLLSLDQ